MIYVGKLKPYFVEPAASGSWAIFWVIVAVAVPTAIRASVQGIVSGCETVPYIPAVLLASIFLGARYGAVVALASALVADALFMGVGHLFLEGPCDIFGTTLFLISSAMIIGSVEVLRAEVGKLPEAPGANERSGGIVFSVENGEAWASWYGQDRPVRLGPQKEVAEMMQDFLAQVELGKFLAERSRNGRDPT
jgi:hypothetical protein